MGQDIHFYVEKQVDDAWVPVELLQMDTEQDPADPIPFMKTWYHKRDYDLFEVLIASFPEGFSLDDIPGVSEQVRQVHDWNEPNYHSVGVMGVDDLEKLEVGNAQFKATVAKMRQAGDTRAVFWFDN